MMNDPQTTADRLRVIAAAISATHPEMAHRLGVLSYTVQRTEQLVFEQSAKLAGLALDRVAADVLPFPPRQGVRPHANDQTLPPEAA